MQQFTHWVYYRHAPFGIRRPRPGTLLRSGLGRNLRGLGLKFRIRFKFVNLGVNLINARSFQAPRHERRCVRGCLCERVCKMKLRWPLQSRVNCLIGRLSSLLDSCNSRIPRHMWGRRNTYLTFSDNRGQIEREAEGDVCVSISVYASACARVCVRVLTICLISGQLGRQLSLWRAKSLFNLESWREGRRGAQIENRVRPQKKKKKKKCRLPSEGRK